MSTSTTALIEKALIQGKWNDQISYASNPVAKYAKQVVDGDFRAVLTSSIAGRLFQTSAAGFDQDLKKTFEFSRYMDPDPAIGELYRLCIAISCLHAFIQANWTGPDLTFEPLDLLALEASNSITEQSLNSKVASELAFGGEPAYHLSKYPAFLRFSQLILEVPFTQIQTPVWWRLRATLLHQQLLDEPVAHELEYENQLEALSSFIGNDPQLSGRMLLERGLLHHLFSQDKLAVEYFVNAARATGMEYRLSGALGKRTKFQVHELSQLILLAESHLDDGPEENTNTVMTTTKTSSPDESGLRENGAVDGNESTKMPETLALNDDTLLEQTEFTSSRPTESFASGLDHIDPSNQPALHPLDQSILLSLCLNVKNTLPAHGLTNEQMAPYIARVISHPRNWSVHTMALLLRSRLESQRTRTVERSTFQLQALIDQMPTSDSTLAERLVYFHSVPLPSKWEMERELALRYMSLGVIKSALEIFERLEMWEDVVQCYTSLSRTDKGLSIVRDLLEGRKEEADSVLSRGKAESARRRAVRDTTREAKLWCLLGDLEPENAPKHYQKAWARSNESSGRAMWSLGGYHFARGNYPEAISCLQRAVGINPLQVRPWFILGCACMREEEWESAKNAFARCVAIDEEDGESWNNLASMYLRLDDGKKKNVDEEADGRNETEQKPAANGAVSFENKIRAYRALKQGLRFSYDNWRMWYNYMVVAMDVGELSEACRALGRVVEQTAGKVGVNAVDEDVLERLVDAVVARASAEGVADAEAQNDAAIPTPNEGLGLLRSVLDLFDRILLPRVSSSRIFRAYARLLKWQLRWKDALKAYLDGYRVSRAGTMEKGVETDAAKWKEALGEVEEIVDILRNFGPQVEGYKWRPQARTIVRTFAARTRDFEDEPEWAKLMDLQEELKKAEED